MSSYILRLKDRDESLWKRVKKQSEKDAVPMRAVIMSLLEMYADGEVSVKASLTRSFHPKP